MYRGRERWTNMQSQSIMARHIRRRQVRGAAGSAGGRHQQAARKAHDGPLNGKAPAGFAAFNHRMPRTSSSNSSRQTIRRRVCGRRSNRGRCRPTSRLGPFFTRVINIHSSQNDAEHLTIRQTSTQTRDAPFSARTQLKVAKMVSKWYIGLPPHHNRFTALFLGPPG